MKLKNEKEIEELAITHISQFEADDYENVTQYAFHTIGEKDGFIRGYTQAQQDLLASASEGFDDWIEDEDHFFRMKHLDDPGIYEGDMKLSWQAAKLSDAKKMQEKDEEIEKLKYYKEQWQDIAGKANLKNLVATVEKLEKENEELIDQLKWALSCIDMNLKEADWNKAFRLMVIHGVNHEQVCWDHPELIEEAAKIKGEAK